MKKLGIYAPILDSKPTGVGVYIYEIIGRLLKLFPDVPIYTATPDTLPEWMKGATLRTCQSPYLKGSSGLRGRLSRLLWLNFHARSAMQRDGVSTLFSLVQEGSLRPSFRQVIVMHDLTALRFPKAYSRWHVLFTRYYMRWCLRAANKVLCVSESTRNDVSGFAGIDKTRIPVVYEGYDASVFYVPHEHEVEFVKLKYNLPDQYFIYSGTFSSHKNLITALQALAIVRGTFPNVKFALCGRSDSGEFLSLMQEAERIGVSNSIIMLGYVPRAHLHALLGGSTAYVFPSLFEGFGLAPLEALASGTVVLSSNSGSLPEVVGDGGILIPPLDVPLWAEKMLFALKTHQDPVCRKRLSQRALLQAQKFSWDSAIKNIVEILNSH